MPPYRQRVTRADGRTINVVQRRGHLSYCYGACCCGRTDRGYAPVPVELYKEEWLKRKLRNVVHMTKGGCLGPCPLANVASLEFDGQSVFFQSVSQPWQVRLIFDYIDSMVRADRFVPPPPELAVFTFDFYDWKARPKQAETVAPLAPVNPNLIALLTHAGTDLMTLDRARPDLPAGIRVLGLSLLSIASDDQMLATLNGELAEAALVLLRIHGRVETVPALEMLRQRCRDRGQRLLVVSGTGELDPRMAQAGDVPIDVLQAVTSYLMCGGPGNLIECVKFVSDRLLLTGHGYQEPQVTPEHGIYLRDIEGADVDDWRKQADPAKAVAAILFYRAHLLSGNTGFVDALAGALSARGLEPVCIFTSSLKDQRDGAPAAFGLFPSAPSVVISTLSFAQGEVNAGGITESGSNVSALERLDAPILQTMAASVPQASWELSSRGLNPLETAINVAIPEFDGRIIGVPISFKERHTGNDGALYAPHPERIARVAGIAAQLVNLRCKPNEQKRVAFVLTNSSSKAAQVGNAVGLDAPASLLNLLRALRGRGYQIRSLPDDSDSLFHELLSRGSYDDNHPLNPATAHKLSVGRYREWFDAFPENVRKRMIRSWKEPGQDINEPWRDASDYLFAGMELGSALVALQPPRGYGMNPDAIYHTPDLPPTHHYAAFYRWLAAPRSTDGWGADAIVHVGKHGTLEWLPGKGIGLSRECFPDLLLGDTPLVYPFIINDPGEGSQAKRRAHAVIVDHLTPPMTIAETYGPLAELNQLVNEYYSLEKLDPSKLSIVQRQIWDLIEKTNLRADLDLKSMLSRDHGDHKHEWDEQATPEGVPATLAEMSGNEVAHLIEDIDGYLCELGLAQIRDGLHILGQMPPLADMLRSLTRLPNVSVPGLQSSLAEHFGYSLADLLDRPGSRLEPPVTVRQSLCHSHADVLRELDQIAFSLYAALEDRGFQIATIDEVQRQIVGDANDTIGAVLDYACRTLVPNLERVDGEVANVLNALEGRYVPAGPAGAPTRGMASILPTGRNFYAVDPRALPSAAAWQVGQQLARETLVRYVSEEGSYPEMIGLSMWGTSQMRTQGDDVAEALSFLGVRPVWNAQSRRIDGVEAIPLNELGRPRIDVTLRISGFFRDAFPHLITLLDDAVRLVVALDEPPEQNFPRKHFLAEMAKTSDLSAEEAEEQALFRIFGAKPGAYGVGLQQLIDTGHWQTADDLARVFLAWGGYAYGRNSYGGDAREVFADRLRTVQVALHNQDNREHDIFDSDDYYQFHGGMVATIRSLTGERPKAYFGDSARPESSRIRDLREEALRVYRSRVVNPKWIASIQRHGYKGGLELTATVDYIFGFDAAADIAPDFVYEELAENYAFDETMREFLERSNPWALNAIAKRLLEASDRGLWEQPPDETLARLRQTVFDSETMLEAREERGVEA
ncbi:MAG TPA: cobaltochelatase subunit CobN [Bryobacteraceae bacterium]|nr:cobaltochelatase subunit CobN [Bryobacteraceae bacterium]